MTVIKQALGLVTFKARVLTRTGGIITAYKSEKAAAFPDDIEKYETGAVRRVLAMLG